MVACDGDIITDTETEELPGGEPWDPGLVVSFDGETSEYVIAQIAFEELKLDPASLSDDSTELRKLESGYYQVATSGELSGALGWEVGDVPLSVDGYDLGGLAEFAAAYTAIADHSRFTLTMRRGQREVVLRYRVE